MELSQRDLNFLIENVKLRKTDKFYVYPRFESVYEWDGELNENGDGDYNLKESKDFEDGDKAILKEGIITEIDYIAEGKESLVGDALTNFLQSYAPPEE